VTTLATDGRHVRAIAAYRLSTFPAGDASFIGRKFMSRPLGVGRSAPLARNLTLFSLIHRRKTAPARICHCAVSFDVILVTADCVYPA
jgi:hypothetical protein